MVCQWVNDEVINMVQHIDKKDTDKAPSLKANELIELINGLDEAKEDHYQWLWDIHRSMLCSTPLKKDSTMNPLHCGFERWYVSVSDILSDDEQFHELGSQHRLMHTAAQKIIFKARKAHPLSTVDYDAFLKERNSFQDKLEIFIRKLWGDACLIDNLTGLRNRHGMMLELRLEQQRALREKTSCVVAMMDIDYFKDINDKYGHKTGDCILHELADFIITRMRPYDRIYRYGGEEFLLCMPDSSLDETGIIIGRLRSEVSNYIFKVNEKEVNITVSFGLAAMSEEQTVAETTDCADQALYSAKQAGRNCVRIYEN